MVSRRTYFIICIIAAIIWNLLFYGFGLTSAQLGHALDFRLPVDDAIPYVPEMVWIYIGTYIMPIIVLLASKNEHCVNRAILALFLATLLAGICFLLLPVRFPYHIPPDTLSGQLLAMQIAMDFETPANKFPSLHVAIPMVLCLSLRGQSLRPAILIACWIYTALIAASTVLVKQHIVVDTLAGLALGPLAWGLACWLYPRLCDPHQPPVAAFRRMSRNSGMVLLFMGIFCIAIPWTLWALADHLQDLHPLHLHIPLWISGFAMAAGGGIMLASMFQMIQFGKGFPVSAVPPPEMLKRGLYAWFRHPIYIGFTALFAGIMAAMDLGWGLLFVTPLLIALWHTYLLVVEEPGLLRRFGPAYEQYRQEVPLFYPTLLLRPLQRPVLGLASLLARRVLLFRAGSQLYFTFGLFLAIGAFVLMHLTAALFLDAQVTPGNVTVTLAVSAVGGLIFAKLFWYFGDLKDVCRRPFARLRQVGYVSYGGFFGLLLGMLYCAVAGGIPFLLCTDILICNMYLYYFIGRLGCISFGCCYGLPHKSGMTYSHPLSKVIREKGSDHPQRHATPLMHAMLGLALFVLLVLLAGQQPPIGMITALGFIGYAAGRAVIECYRDRKRLPANLTTGHLGAIAILLGGIALLLFITPGQPFALSYRPIFETASQLYITIPLSLITFVYMSLHVKEPGKW